MSRVTLSCCYSHSPAGNSNRPSACRDPALRIHLLQLLERVLANEDQANAFEGAAAQQLAEEALLPAFVWRAGKTAAAVRFAAISALSALFAHHLLHTTQWYAHPHG